MYYKYSRFLPFINNEKQTENSTSFKKGLTKLKKLILIGGPDDGVITPWESSQFGYYDKNETIIEMRNRPVYQNDLIGLKTLDKKKKLVIHSVPGVKHYMWHTNASLVDQYILPYLN